MAKLREEDGEKVKTNHAEHQRKSMAKLREEDEEK